MPVRPKFLHVLGLSLRTAGVEWRLRRRGGGPAEQAEALNALLPRLAAASHWRGLGVEAKLGYAAFQARVPLQTHASIAPAVARMVAGEAAVLWPGACRLFARTAGVADGTRRLVPVTEELLTHFQTAGLRAVLHHAVAARNAGVFRGRHLLLGGTAAVEPVDAARPDGAVSGELSGIAALSLPGWAARHLHEPGLAAAAITDPDQRLAAVLARVAGTDLSLVAGLPGEIVAFARAALARTAADSLSARWPNLECIVHGGEALGFHADALRELAGPGVRLHEVYAATEAFIAAQDGEASQGLRLLADQGVFFEFIPLEELEAGSFETAGRRALPLAGVKVGVDYALIVTTPGGLVRHLLEDVVRFTSVAPARLLVVGRTGRRLDVFRENLDERDAGAALTAACRRQGWRMVDHHVAPQVTVETLVGERRGRHEWWIELNPGTMATPTGPQLAAELDAKLTVTHPTYADRRARGILEAPVVRLVIPGVFEHWRRFHGRWGGQNKMTRCARDRVIADEFDAMTKFAPH
ncbi:MAG: GH3 auxin-responsive promoter family protein [Opitutaceae bacterium]